MVSDPVSPIVSISVTPSSVSLASGSTQAFAASATRQDGSTLVPGVTWSATGGTVNASGIYTAGGTAGSYRVIAVQQGGTLADTSAVTVTATAPVLQAVILSPASVTLNTGATQQFSVSGQWSNGSTAAPAVTYTATGGSITAGGLVRGWLHRWYLPGHRHAAGWHAGGFCGGDAHRRRQLVAPTNVRPPRPAGSGATISSRTD